MCESPSIILMVTCSWEYYDLNIQDQLRSRKVHMALMKPGDNWCKTQFLVQTRLKVEPFMFRTVCIYRKRQAVTQTYLCSVWSCYAHTGHSCTRRVSASPEDGSAASPLAQGEGAAQGWLQAQQPQWPPWPLSVEGLAITQHRVGLSLFPTLTQRRH